MIFFHWAKKTDYLHSFGEATQIHVLYLSLGCLSTLWAVVTTHSDVPSLTFVNKFVFLIELIDHRIGCEFHQNFSSLHVIGSHDPKIKCYPLRLFSVISYYTINNSDPPMGIDFPCSPKEIFNAFHSNHASSK